MRRFVASRVRSCTVDHNEPSHRWEVARSRRVASLNGSAGADGRLGLLRRVSQIVPEDHGPQDDDFEQRYPDLTALLYAGTWDAIQPREAPRLTISAKGGSVVGKLEMPSEGLWVPATADSLEKFLQVLDFYARTGSGPWQELKWGTAAQRKRDLRKKELDKRFAARD